MIALTDTDGLLVAINPMAVFCITEDEDRTAITSIGGAVVMVQERFSEVEKRMKAWTKS